MSENYLSLNRMTNEEFNLLKEKYCQEQRKYKNAFLFHVGVGAGFYSEVGGMLEAVLYSHYKKCRFILYADDANFSNSGWNDFFEEFCKMNHNKLNIHANNRGFCGNRAKTTLQNIMNMVLKLSSGCKFTTNDWWNDLIGQKFKETIIDWDLFEIHGSVRNEYAKLSRLAMRYNDETWNEMSNLVDKLRLPCNYISVHIRGGDKINEVEELITVDRCIQVIEATNKAVNNVFVFTDDYRNIEEIKIKKPDWNVYTLTQKVETGYINETFNQCSWTNKRKQLIKLFAIVEICINSKIHYGDEYSCVNNYIFSSKEPEEYISLR